RAGVAGRPDWLHRPARDALAILLRPGFAIAPRLHAHPGGEGVDHRDAHAVQATGELVAVAAKLPASVQLRHHDFQRRALLLRMDLGWDAAAEVAGVD